MICVQHTDNVARMHFWKHDADGVERKEKPKNDDGIDICPICHETLEESNRNVTETLCHHKFCTECLRKVYGYLDSVRYQHFLIVPV